MRPVIKPATSAFSRPYAKNWLAIPIHFGVADLSTAYVLRTWSPAFRG